MATRAEFIIYTPPFDEKMGGVMALLALCERLNALGYPAAIWPWDKPARVVEQYRQFAKYVLKRKWRRYAGPFTNPIATYRDLRDAVVIYPEIIAGNPLGAKRVVRWLLHKPGYHTKTVEFGATELFFFYQEAFNDASLNPHRDRLLQISYFHPAYRNTNPGRRSKTSVIYRKGRDRVHDKHPADSIVLDALSHEETAAVLNDCELMYSYDPYSFYSVYAIMCGCVPVIIPEAGVSKADWSPCGSQALGQAYGVEEIELARSQRGEFMQRLACRRAEEDEQIRRFVAICREAPRRDPT